MNASLIQNLQAFIATTSRLIRYRLLSENPELLCQANINHMKVWREQARNNRDFHKTESLSEAIQLLSVCCRLGPAPAIFGLPKEYPNLITAVPDFILDPLKALATPAQPEKVNNRRLQLEEFLREVNRDHQPLLWVELQLYLVETLLTGNGGDQHDKLNEALIIFNEVDRVFPREIAPVLWAEIQIRYAEVLLADTESKLGDNVTQAIVRGKSALKVLTSGHQTILHARSESLLGIAFLAWLRGDRGANIEIGIRYLRKALKVFREENFPLSWAMALANLSIAYNNRVQGDRGANLERAIRLCRLSSHVFHQDFESISWIQNRNNMAVLQINRIKGDRNRNLERAIQHLIQAQSGLDRVDNPSIKRMIGNNLCAAYVNRYQGDRAENLETALRCCKQGLSEHSGRTSPLIIARSQHNFATILMLRLRNNHSENLKQAIEQYRQTIQTCDPETYPLAYAAFHNSIGIAELLQKSSNWNEYLERIVLHSNLALELALLITLPKRIQNENLGSSAPLWNPVRGDRLAGIEQLRILNVQEQHGEFDTLPPDAGIDLIPDIDEQEEPSHEEDCIDRAIYSLRLGLRTLTGHHLPFLKAQLENNLALSYIERSQGDRANNLDQALQLSNSALAVYQESIYPVYFAWTQNFIAYAYSERSDRLVQENLERALYHAELALYVMNLRAFPFYWTWTQMHLADIHLRYGNWLLALHRFEQIHLRYEQVQRHEVTQESAVMRLEETAKIYSPAAWCYTQLGNFRHALQWLERGKTRLLRERMARDRALFLQLRPEHRRAYIRIDKRLRVLTANQQSAKLSDRSFSDSAAAVRKQRIQLQRLIEKIRAYQPLFLSEGLSYQDMVNRLPERGNAAILVFNVTAGGAVIAIVSGTSGKPMEKTIVIKEFTSRSLREFTVKWLKIVRYLKIPMPPASSKTAFGDAVSNLMAELYEKLFARIRPVLDALQPQILILIPHQTLHALPLHLMNRQQDNKRRYLMDDYEIRYAPSFELLHASPIETDDSPIESLVAIIDPTEDLVWSREEVRHIEPFFIKKRIFRGREACITEIVAESKQSQVVHFACHAEFDMENPYNSRLYLAAARSGSAASNGSLWGSGTKLDFRTKSRGMNVDSISNATTSEEWTLSQILRDLKLPNARLVVLSACETGIVAVDRIPDEYLGLAAGFLAAGAGSVVSSLWKVDDESTCELMRRFYQLFVEEKQSPSAAMRNTQLWVRSQSKYDNSFYWGAFIVSG